MITMENLIAGSDEGAEMQADTIIALMKRAYESGYERGHAAGQSERKTMSISVDLSAIAEATEEGYTKGHEDGYDQACMDLTDDDLGSKLNGKCDGCFGASFNDCDRCRGVVAEDDPQE